MLNRQIASSIFMNKKRGNSTSKQSNNFTAVQCHPRRSKITLRFRNGNSVNPFFGENVHYYFSYFLKKKIHLLLNCT